MSGSKYFKENLSVPWACANMTAYWCTVLTSGVCVCGLFPPCWQGGVFVTANKPFRGLYGWQRRIGMVTCYDRRPAQSNQAVSVAVNQTQTCWLLFKHREKDKKDGWYKSIERDTFTHHAHIPINPFSSTHVLCNAVPFNWWLFVLKGHISPHPAWRSLS